jgi:SPP1 gp7 family putative phage head morphogenesis protein
VPAKIPSDPDRFEEAVEAFRKRVPMTRKQWDKLKSAQREHAFMVSEVARADLITEVYEAVDRAIADGTDFKEFQTEIRSKLVEHWGGDKPGRIETIFRTNVMTNYNAGRHAVFSAPAVREARPYLRFDGVEDARQSDLCSELNGLVLPADDPFWRTHTPPLHHQCRSTLVALSNEEARDEGISRRVPEEEAGEGFGAPPSKEGDDWEGPDIGLYPDEIGKELGRRLADGPDDSDE